ncbi:MAG: hypothetical protein R3C02_14965 [Planctomycetaceae bacterium]
MSAASRSEVATPATVSEQIKTLFRAILSRDPTVDEMELAQSLLDSSSGELATLSQALLMTNEFLFVDD